MKENLLCELELGHHLLSSTNEAPLGGGWAFSVKCGCEPLASSVLRLLEYVPMTSLALWGLKLTGSTLWDISASIST